jgi:DNA-binding HxlR family transcriptional regulator
MKGYGQFCPVARASEVLAERWTPLILRELLCGSHRFNDLHRGVPLISRSLLAKRLRELEEAGVVERRTVRGGHRAGEYHLTPAGKELRPIVESLGVWGQRWIVADVAEDELDASLLMWDVRRNLRQKELPDRRVVVRFEFTDVKGTEKRWWLLTEPDGADLCMTDPGFEVDLTLFASLRGMTRYWIGRASWHGLLKSGELRLEGPRWLQRALPRWLQRSPFAGVPHAADRTR